MGVHLNDQVAVIDTLTNTVITTISAGLRPLGIAIPPDGCCVYIANEEPSPYMITVIDAKSNTVKTTVPVPLSPWGLAIIPPTLTVGIDIKPGSFPKTINLGSAGVVPVAILSSPTFDAQKVDPESVTLAGASVKLIRKGDRYSCSAVDVNGDGLPDLLCHVVTTEFALQPGESLAVLEAKTFAGQRVRGEASIQIVP